MSILSILSYLGWSGLSTSVLSPHLKVAAFLVRIVAKAKINSASFWSSWSGCVTHHHHHMPSVLPSSWKLERQFFFFSFFFFYELLPYCRWLPIAQPRCCLSALPSERGDKPDDPRQDWPDYCVLIPAISLAYCQRWKWVLGSRPQSWESHIIESEGGESQHVDTLSVFFSFILFDQGTEHVNTAK